MHTLLHVAARHGHGEVMKLLMKADPKLCCSANSAKESPLFLATCKGFSSIARDILNESSISPSFQGINGVTALHAAVTHQYPSAEGIVEIIVSKYPDMIKKVDSLGWTPLHYAAYRGNLEATRLLIKWDKSNTSYLLDKSGMSALHVAAYKGHIEVLKDLLQNLPDSCECLTAKHQTILHVAVLGEQSSVVEYIMKTPDLARLVDKADKEGKTPLHLAVACQVHEIIKILTVDCGLKNTTIQKEFSLIFDNFLGDNIEVQEIIDSSYQGRFFGVPLFQKQISSEFKKLEYHSKAEKPGTGTPAVVDHKQISRATETNLLITALITTVTFTAALAPPGGYGDDGRMILAESKSFKWFWAFNTVSFALSFISLFAHSIADYFNSGSFADYFDSGNFDHLRKPGRVNMLVSLGGMLAAFYMGKAATMPKAISLTHDFGISVVAIGLMLLASSRPYIQLIKIILEIWNAIHRKDLFPDEPCNSYTFVFCFLFFLPTR